MKTKKCVVAFTHILFLFLACGGAKAEVVYDTIGSARPTFGGAIGLATGSQGGSIITLGGSSRVVTHVDVVIAELNSIPGDLDYKINFWSAVGVPGTLLWSSPVAHVGPLNQTPIILGVDVPMVQVPNKFGWTIESVHASDQPGVIYVSNNLYAGAANAEWYYNPSFGWQKSDLPPGSSDVGFRVTAIPEPTSFVLFVIGSTGLCCASARRKRNCN